MINFAALDLFPQYINIKASEACNITNNAFGKYLHPKLDSVSLHALVCIGPSN